MNKEQPIFPEIPVEPMEPKTKVNFRVCNGPYQKGEIIACFFELEASRGMMQTYMHTGQHGDAAVDYVRKLKPAKPADYADLKNELENAVGYDLEVCARIVLPRQGMVKCRRCGAYFKPGRYEYEQKMAEERANLAQSFQAGFEPVRMSFEEWVNKNNLHKCKKK